MTPEEKLERIKYELSVSQSPQRKLEAVTFIVKSEE